MPCRECGHPLLVIYKYENLRCPSCLDIPIEDQQAVEKRAEKDEQLLDDDNLLGLLEQYDRNHLILYFVQRLNEVSYEFRETRALHQQTFVYLNYLIKIIYEADESRFGDQYLNTEDGADETVDTLLATQSDLQTSLNQVKDKSRLCVEYGVPVDSSRFIFSQYHLFDSEFRYCYHRCVNSLVGGGEDNKALFDRVEQQLRGFDRPNASDINDSESFGNAFYKLICSMAFMASENGIANSIYRTELPESVSIIKIREFLDRIQLQFSDGGDMILEDERLGMTSQEGLNEAGSRVFGEKWDAVRDRVVVSHEQIDAHPFLFELGVDVPVTSAPGRDPVTVEKQRYFFPVFYALLLEFQIFPLLQNGDEPSGMELLERIGDDRGTQFEQKVYEYLSQEGYRCYYSADLPGDDASEIDVVVVDDVNEELWFIECKYLLPELNMNEAQGIKRLNQKFDSKVFVEANDYDDSPSGEPFPDKVDKWLSLNPGSEFTWENPETGEDQADALTTERLEYDVSMYVVSNLTPSYVEKQGVKFRTDMEFVQILDGEDPVFERID